MYYNVKEAVLVDCDGHSGTINDQLALEFENVVKGGLTRGTEFFSRRCLRVEEKPSFDRNVTKKGIPKTRHIAPVLSK